MFSILMSKFNYFLFVRPQKLLKPLRSCYLSFFFINLQRCKKFIFSPCWNGISRFIGNIVEERNYITKEAQALMLQKLHFLNYF